MIHIFNNSIQGKENLTLDYLHVSWGLCIIKLFTFYNFVDQQTWGQIHWYLKVFKYFYKVFVIVFIFDIKELKAYVFKYFHKVFDIFKLFQILSNTFSNTLSISTFLFYDHM